MKRARTINLLQDLLDHDFAWRLKEIDNLINTVQKTPQMMERTLIRAAVPILYAHWEGFVKATACNYLDFVNCQGHKYNELISCFIVFGMKKKLNEVVASKQASKNISILDFIFNELSKSAQLKIDTAIDTESNLSSSVFENIALSIGLDPSPYETKYKFIDESLLRRRNSIAHGEYLDINPTQFKTLADDVIVLLRNFKTDIENAASQAKYKRTA